MGVHWCGWCGGMSGGGFCDECQKEFDAHCIKVEKDLKVLCGSKYKDIKKRIGKIINAVSGCY